MHGIGVVSHQNGQGMNGQNPDAQRGYGFLERKLGTGDKTLLELAGQSLELAGQNPEAAAQQAEQIVKDESQNFNEREFEELFGATIEAIGEIYNLVQVPNANRIRKEVLSIAMPFAEEVGRLSIETLAAIQQVLSNNSGSTNPNKPPISFWSPNTPSKQNPQGTVSAA